MRLGVAVHSAVPKTLHKNRLYHFVCENKQCWNLYKLCNPKAMLSRCPFQSEKYCSHPHAGLGLSTGVCRCFLEVFLTPHGVRFMVKCS